MGCTKKGRLSDTVHMEGTRPSRLYTWSNGLLLTLTLILAMASKAAAQIDCSLDGFTFFQYERCNDTCGSNLGFCGGWASDWSLDSDVKYFQSVNAAGCRNNSDCQAITLYAEVGNWNQATCNKAALGPFTNVSQTATHPCQGIYVKDTHYICRDWSAIDNVWRNSGIADVTVCQSYPGFVWTGGSNANYTNCGTCSCCAPASIASTAVSSLGPPPSPPPPPSVPPSPPRPPLPQPPSPPSPLLSPFPTPPKPPAQTPSPSPPGLPSATSSAPPAVNAGAIAGAVIGAVVGVTALALLAWWLMQKNRGRPLSNLCPDPSGHVEIALFPIKDSSTGESDQKGLNQAPPTAITPAPSKVPLDDRLSELSIAWESIEIGTVLGSGGFADVYRGTWQENPVAVKMLNLKRLSVDAQEELRKEALAMHKLPHPCIAQVYGLVDDGTHHALVMRYYKRGSVADVIAKPEYASLDLTQRLKMAVQVASGMCYLHGRHLIHGDLKTANLLIEDTGRGVVIADFGLSGVAGQAVASGAMTVSISPPEVLIDPRAPRTEAGDVYAFAIVLFEIVTGFAAYRGMRPAQLRDVVISGRRPTIPECVPACITTIIMACWSQDAAARPNFTEVLRQLVAATEACRPSQPQRFEPGSSHRFMTTTTATHTLTLHNLTSTNI